MFNKVKIWAKKCCVYLQYTVQYSTSARNNAVFGNNAVSVPARPITEIIIIRIYF